MRAGFRKKKVNRSIGMTILLGLLLAGLGMFMVLPLLYATVSAFKPMEEFFIFPPRFFVMNPTIENFTLMGQLISNMWVSFERYLFNTVFVSVVSTLVYLIIASLAAYPLAKHQFPGCNTIKNVITTALLFTTAVTAIPQYIIMAKLGMINTYSALIFPTLSNTMGVFLCIQYLSTIPGEMLEAGKIDGAGEYRIWWDLVLPNIKPVLATVLIFQFQGVWNQTGSNLIFSESLKLLPTALSQITSAGISRAGVGSAASLLLMLPPILVFVIAQNSVMETMVHSGIKG